MANRADRSLPLRPLSATQTVDQAVSLYRTHFRAIGRVLLVFIGIVVLYQAVNSVQSATLEYWAAFFPLQGDLVFQALTLIGNGMNPAVLWDLYGIPVGTHLLVTLVATSLVIPMAAARYLSDGADPMLEQPSAARVLRLVVPVLIATPAFTFAPVLGDLFWMSQWYIVTVHEADPSWRNMLTSGLQLWLQPIVLGLLLLAASTRLLLLAPIVALEPVGLGTAVQRSWTLSRGAFGRIFIAMLICSCIGGVLIALPMLTSELVLGDAASEESSAIVRSLGPLGSRLAEVFIFPIPVIALTLLYYGQRFRHEGYDLDMLLQRETAAAVQAMIKPLATGEGLSDPQSLPILNAALECDPLHPQARYFRSWVRHETGDQQGALEDVALVVQRYSHDPHTLLLRAAIYWTLGDVAAAGRDVMQINRMRPEMVRELEQSATDAFTRGNLALSLTYLNRMLLLAPTSAWAHYNRACVLARQHAGDEALASLRTAISYDPQWRTQAVDDADLASLRDDPRFGALLSAK